MSKEDILKILFSAIDQLNAQRNQPLEKVPSLSLSGTASKLDSLGFVNFIVSAEILLASELGISISLTSEDLISNPDGPFRTIETLVNYIAEKTYTQP